MYAGERYPPCGGLGWAGALAWGGYQSPAARGIHALLTRCQPIFIGPARRAAAVRASLARGRPPEATQRWRSGNRKSAGTFAGSPALSLHVDETGSYIAAIPSTLTDTDETGEEAASHCLNWSSGEASEGGWRGFASLDSNGQWTDHSAVPCNQNGRFYCFSNVVTIFWDGFDLTEDPSRWSSSTP